MVVVVVIVSSLPPHHSNTIYARLLLIFLDIARCNSNGDMICADNAAEISMNVLMIVAVIRNTVRQFVAICKGRIRESGIIVRFEVVEFTRLLPTTSRFR